MPDKRCGKDALHHPHWQGKNWCDGKPYPTQHSGGS